MVQPSDNVEFGPKPGPEPLFQLTGQDLGYGSQAVLKQLHLSIHAGEKVALLGPSGSGKSTLLRKLYHQQRHRCALLPQQLGLVEVLSVFHNIYMGRLSQRSALYNLFNLISPRPEPVTQIRSLAESLGIESLLWRSVDSLSGGQQQRTALGRALYQNCQLFIGDEPVSSVDPFRAESMLSLINQQHQTVVVALHDREQALSHFDRIIGLSRGRIVLDQPCSELEPQQLAAIYRS
ncbi:ATP-binding cassette domain-containing protein [Motiliproteus sp.]|uniref:ATP-binding cassette domain-containing protein n=1 Tax=Motiliproteus sp. TaxID=1898955 RepID=UPI003BA8F565